MITPSQYQIDIWDHFENRNREHLVVQALAGSGKTTTVIRGLEYIPYGRVVLTSFGKDIVEELKARTPDDANARIQTLHGLGLSSVFRNLHPKERDPDRYKAHNHARELLKKAELPFTRENTNALAKAAEWCKHTMTATAEQALEVVDRLDTNIVADCKTSSDPDDNTTPKVPKGQVAELVIALLMRCAEDLDRFDYNDMIWLPLVRNLTLPQFDHVLVDECFVGDTPVLIDRTGRTRPIRELVEEHYAGAVPSFDGQRTTDKRVVGWHKIPVRGELVCVEIQQRGFAKDGTRLSPLTERVRYGRRRVVCTPDQLFWTPQGDVAARDLRPGTGIQIETLAPRDSGYNHRHKHSNAGRVALAEQMTCRNAFGICGDNNQQGRVVQQGGNGRGPNSTEQALLERLGGDWRWNYAVATGRPRQPGRPTHYKIDLAHPERFLAIEVDGRSHASRREIDARKDAFLERAGWTVIRLTNAEAIRLTDEQLQERIAACPVEAEVVGVVPYTPREPFVYDLTIEDTHHFYAHGVLVHNCQDMNPAQIMLARRLLAPGGRIIAVGDTNQSIYQFRGADEKAMDNIVQGFTARTLPLSVTYRCAEAIVAEANRFVPELEVAPGAPQGLVRRVDLGEFWALPRPGDFVLSRANAPLAAVGAELRASGLPILQLGSETGRQVIELIKKSKTRDTDSLQAWLDDHEERSIERLTKENRKEALANLIDLIETARGFALGFDRVQHVIDHILEVYADQPAPNKITLSSVHKIKGKEADRVFLLTATFLRRNTQEEQNIAYVAVTRARTELYWVTGNVYDLVNKRGRPRIVDRNHLIAQLDRERGDLHDTDDDDDVPY